MAHHGLIVEAIDTSSCNVYAIPQRELRSLDQFAAMNRSFSMSAAGNSHYPSVLISNAILKWSRQQRKHL